MSNAHSLPRLADDPPKKSVLAQVTVPSAEAKPSPIARFGDEREYVANWVRSVLIGRIDNAAHFGLLGEVFGDTIKVMDECRRILGDDDLNRIEKIEKMESAVSRCDYTFYEALQAINEALFPEDFLPDSTLQGIVPRGGGQKMSAGRLQAFLDKVLGNKKPQKPLNQKYCEKIP